MVSIILKFPDEIFSFLAIIPSKISVITPKYNKVKTTNLEFIRFENIKTLITKAKTSRLYKSIFGRYFLNLSSLL
jgi:hypothetical protein